MEKKNEKKIWEGKMAKKLFPAAGTEYKEKRSPGARTSETTKEGQQAGASSRRV